MDAVCFYLRKIYNFFKKQGMQLIAFAIRTGKLTMVQIFEVFAKFSFYCTYQGII